MTTRLPLVFACLLVVACGKSDAPAPTPTGAPPTSPAGGTAGSSLALWDKVDGAPWRATAQRLGEDDPRASLCGLTDEGICDADDPIPCHAWLADGSISDGAAPIAGASVVGTARGEGDETQRERWCLVIDTGSGWVLGGEVFDFYAEAPTAYRGPRWQTFARAGAGSGAVIRLDVVEAPQPGGDDDDPETTQRAFSWLCGADGDQPICARVITRVKITGDEDKRVRSEWSRSLSLDAEGRAVLGSVVPATSDAVDLPEARPWTLAGLRDHVPAAREEAPPAPGESGAVAPEGGPPLAEDHPLWRVCDTFRRREAHDVDEWSCREERSMEGGAGAMTRVAILRFTSFDMGMIDQRFLAFGGDAGWTAGPVVADLSVSGVGGSNAAGEVTGSALRVVDGAPILEVIAWEEQGYALMSDNLHTSTTTRKRWLCTLVEGAPACVMVPTAITLEVGLIDEGEPAPPVDEFGEVGTRTWERTFALEGATVVVGEADGFSPTGSPDLASGRHSLGDLLEGPEGIVVWRP